MTVTNATPDPLRNPLASTVFIWLALDLFFAKQAYDKDQLDFFAVLPLLQAVILFILYLRRSKYAGEFLFWSTAPVYPVYFGATALGWYGPPIRPATYLIAGVIWCIGLVFLWRLRRSYNAFLVARQPLS